MNVKHHRVEVNGLRLHVAEQGEGPLVLLLHGFPESWYSWRHQFAALAEAGYRVVAPDQRGYARSDRAASVEEYSLPHLAGDVTALIGALGAEEAVLVGHDWGAPVAWTTALLRPDLVRAVAGLSVPPLPPTGMPSTGSSRRTYGEGYYQVYFQEPGRADAELAADPAATMRRLLVGASGDNPDRSWPRPWIVGEGEALLDGMPEPAELPDWLTAEDVAVFAEDYSAPDAFTGPLNWYRNIDRNQGLMSAFHGLRIEVPALYVAGDRDMVTVLEGVPELRGMLPLIAPKLHADITLSGCGHWTQQERPKEVNAALLDFLAAL
ncbi:epoxide hydrolase [Nocardiopsis terrae]|uniref:Pimeloyl-ACP methyl ester carboxylesterase n=1 Tax=Nocardiopsis terrae TaxID=372655 RepID=A0ABR9HF05_9ACTN|nr:alpha/beta hydrolase [Nocardiopsis terrae]MBE1457608.1 pimeloyl-ACP methyl ester carboxylesterase [Nocardiopsis terrae]GHC85212.1 epoxide hydrolase [Nocardiopsis terrae]